MKVRVKESPQPRPTLDSQQKLDAGFISNRVRKLAGSSIPLSEFFTFMPLICYTCARARKPEQLAVGGDMCIRCIDRDDCQKHWYGKDNNAPVKKHKFKIKGA